MTHLKNETDSNSGTTSPLNEKLKGAAAAARNWALTLFIIFVGIKTVLIFTEPAISLRFWEWILIWPAMSYQHLIMAGLVFALYLGIFYLGTLNRISKYVGVVIVSGLQALLPFLHISSLRVAHILGGYTTFEMIQADAEGSIFTQALMDPKNLPYTLPGAALSVLAVLLPMLVLGRFNWWPKRLSIKVTAIIIAAWIGIGIVCSVSIRSYTSVADQDPIAFFYTDMIGKKLSGAMNESGKNAGSFINDTPIFGDRTVYKTRKLFSNLDKWRKTKQNIVLIVLESLPAKQASFMGQVKPAKEETRDTMPNIRKLTNHALLLKNHYTVHPTSMNALFSLGCSLYPYPPGGNITRLNPRIPCHSLSEILTQKGHIAGLYHSGRFSFWNKLRFYRRRGFKVMNDAKNMPGHKEATPFQWGIEERVTARAVVEFMKKNKNKSFFVQYMPVFPHAPYDYAPGDWSIFEEKTKQDKYHNCLRYADASVNIVLQGIKDLGLEEDTLIIFVGDHGEAFHEHRGNRVHSIYVYEENVHVAAIMVNPLLFPTKRSTERVTSHIDILPTVADLVGVERKKLWRGKSLLRDSPSRPVYFFANWGPKLVGVRDGKYKMMWERKKNTFELFDLEKDPTEQKNIINQHKNRINTYRNALDRWFEYHKNTIPTLGKSDDQIAKEKEREQKRKEARERKRKEAKERKRKENLLKKKK